MFEQISINETCSQLHAQNTQGLSGIAAAGRYQSENKNELKEARKKTFLERFIEQLNDPLIYVLLAAAAVSFLLKEASDAFIILVVVGMNATVGLIQEGKAQKALESLKKLTSPKAYVIREGKELEIPASELVVGDLVCLEAGGQVPADLRLVESMSLKIEESALTGESLPVEKDAKVLIEPGRPMGDHKNMAYMSTLVTYGRGRGIVTAIGMDTEIGKIASLINETKEELTPLQKRLGDLGRLLSFISIALCLSLFVIAIIQKRNIFDMLITAISLAVAAVPEGLPAVVTICLALSVTKMVKVNNIVRKLPSVETLGAVNIVCSDKTGTLTQNQMTVVQYYTNEMIYNASSISLNQWGEFLQAMVLCNDAVVTPESRIGDPTELALVDFAKKAGADKEELSQRYLRIKERAFDSDRKMMSTCHNVGGRKITYTKGAPDIIIQRCTSVWMNKEICPITEKHRKNIKKAMEEMASQALRTLAVAMRIEDDMLLENNMIFLGMVGMEDPLRSEAKEAVEIFINAGVGTVMITGDHVDTAYAIGRQLGIVRTMEECMSGEEIQKISEDELVDKIKNIHVFARVTPEHKVKIVRAFKKRGNIVAMTGDGVNDAPSLKAADIGIAMGKNGTDVAKQASDLILTDDNFATIEKAIEEGRGVYANIKKSVLFLLSSNFGEIMTMFAAIICGMPIPLKSSHILWINLITDSLPALALGIDKNDGRELMKQPPRKSGESLFAHGGFACTIFYGGLIAAISLTAFITLPYTILTSHQLPITLNNMKELLQDTAILTRSQTYAFTVLGMSQLFHAIGMREIHKSVFRMKHRDNMLMVGALVLGVMLQLAVTKIPGLTNAFGTVSLTMKEWIRLGILSAFPLLAHEIFILCSFKTERKENPEPLKLF